MDERLLILIGGSAGAGKSTVAKALAKQLDAGWLQLDTVWIAMREAVPSDSPERARLHIDQRIRAGGESAEVLLQAHIETSRAVCAVLPRALAFELQTHSTLVADGAWLLPEFVAGLRMDGVTVSACYLYEEDPTEVQSAMSSRRAVPVTAPWHALGAQVSWMYGNYLAAEANRLGQPVASALPRESLLERVAAAVR